MKASKGFARAVDTSPEFKAMADVVAKQVEEGVPTNHVIAGLVMTLAAVCGASGAKIEGVAKLLVSEHSAMEARNE